MKRIVFSIVVAIAISLTWSFPRAGRAGVLGTVEHTFNFHANYLIADPTRPYMYATTDSSLEIINTNTLAVQKSPPLSAGGFGMSLSADGKRLFVAGGSANAIDIVDLNLQSVQGSLNVGDFASSVATGLNNRLFVATASNTWFNSVVKQIDAASGLSRGPNVLNGGSVYSGALQISPDGTSLYYATYGLSPGDLYKFNVAGTTPVLLYHNSQDIGENGEQVVLSPDGSMVAYVCGYGYNGYQIPNFSAGSMSVKGVFATGAYPDALAYSPDGKFAYALHSVYPTAVDVYNTSSYALVGQFPAMDRGFDMMVDHTGQHLFASYTSTYFGQNNLVAYATAYSVPEPSTLVILASGIVFISKRGKVLKRR